MRPFLIKSIARTSAAVLFALGGHVAAQNDQDAHALMRQGLTALHYFEYEEANDAFRRAQAIDPGSVMACWGEAKPDDRDVASFYALALLGTMSRSLIGYVDAHEGHSASLAGSETQTRVNEILRKVLTTHPDHPGALHYLLHNDDDPAHAHEAV